MGYWKSDTSDNSFDDTVFCTPKHHCVWWNCFSTPLISNPFRTLWKDQFGRLKSLDQDLLGCASLPWVSQGASLLSQASAVFDTGSERSLKKVCSPSMQMQRLRLSLPPPTDLIRHGMTLRYIVLHDLRCVSKIMLAISHAAAVAASACGRARPLAAVVSAPCRSPSTCGVAWCFIM